MASIYRCRQRPIISAKLDLFATISTAIQPKPQRFLYYSRQSHTSWPTQSITASQAKAPQEEEEEAAAAATTATATAAWSPTKYLAFNNERMKPALDLLHKLSKYDMNGKRVVDLGCGPGNSTQALALTWPGANVTGIDSSRSMLERARADVQRADHPASASPKVKFRQGDLATWTAADHPDGGPVDLFFSNAALHWLRTPERIPAIVRLFRAQNPGGVFALQVPDNYAEPSHVLMREVALLPGRAWTGIFLDVGVGYLGTLPRAVRHSAVMAARPDLDPIEPAEDYYDALVPYASELEIWNTTYSHVLPGPPHIVAWVESSGLMPYLALLPTEAMKAEFKAEYLDCIARAYRPTCDAKVILRYPRRFLVAQRK